MLLTKQQAIDVFGGSGAELGRAVGLSRGRISQWPKVLPQRETDLVVGAAMRLGKTLPDGFAVASVQQEAV
jgi:transcriptional repressor of cell division inhibition gene dicB